MTWGKKCQQVKNLQIWITANVFVSVIPVTFSVSWFSCSITHSLCSRRSDGATASTCFWRRIFPRETVVLADELVSRMEACLAFIRKMICFLWTPLPFGCLGTSIGRDASLPGQSDFLNTAEFAIRLSRYATFLSFISSSHSPQPSGCGKLSLSRGVTRSWKHQRNDYVVLGVKTHKLCK